MPFGLTSRQPWWLISPQNSSLKDGWHVKFMCWSHTAACSRCISLKIWSKKFNFLCDPIINMTHLLLDRRICYGGSLWLLWRQIRALIHQTLTLTEKTQYKLEAPNLWLKFKPHLGFVFIPIAIKFKPNVLLYYIFFFFFSRFRRLVCTTRFSPQIMNTT